MMQNTGIAAMVPQGGQQSAPSIPEEMQPRPQGGVTGGIAPPMGELDKRTLAMAVLGQVPGVQPAAALGRLNKIVEAEKMQQAMAAQQAMAQNNAMQQQPPVAQQVLSQAMSSGIGAQPFNYATGGIVGYAEGGSTSPDPEEDRQAVINLLNSLVQQGLLPAGASVADLATAIPRGLMGAYNSTVVRGMRAAGLPAAYIPDFLGGNDYETMTPFYDRVIRGREKEAESETPNPATRVGTEKGRASNPNQVTYVPPIQAAPMSSRPAATTAGGISGSSRVSASGVRSGLPVGGPDEVAEANRQFLEALKGAGTVPGEELSAREALRKRLEEVQKQRLARQEKLETDLEARRRGLDSRPTGLNDAELLLRMAGSVGGARTLGEALSKSAGAAGEYAGERRKERSEAERAMREEGMGLMKLREANEDLKTALYEKDLAYASGDAAAKRAADLKLAEARASFAAAERAYALEKYKAETGRISANASAARGGDGGLTVWQLIQARDKARDNIAQGKNFPQELAAARNEARKAGVPFDEKAWMDSRVNAEVARLMGQQVSSAPSSGGVPPGFIVQR